MSLRTAPHSSREISSAGLEGNIPAQFTRMSTPPYLSTAAAMSFSSAPSSVMSTITASNLLCPRVSFRLASPSPSRSTPSTEAPLLHSPSDIARPNPRAAPVTIAVWPESSPFKLTGTSSTLLPTAGGTDSVHDGASDSDSYNPQNQLCENCFFISGSLPTVSEGCQPYDKGERSREAAQNSASA